MKKPTPYYTFQIWRNNITHQWYWRLVHRNGKIVADSGEGYKRKGTLLRSLKGMLNQLKLGDYKFHELE